MEAIQQILKYLNFPILDYNGYSLTLANVLIAIFIYIVAKLAVRLANSFILKRIYNRRNIEAGRRYAIQTFIKYIIYVTAFLLILQALGAKPTALLAGGAALLVGIGLALQQTFNDIISGVIILLDDSSVEVEDIVEVNGMIGRIKHITLRTTHLETRDRVIKVIPNSVITGQSLINWSSNRSANRFQVYVGVSYSSDVNKVTELLLEVANSNVRILKSPKPTVQFLDFGSSSLDFVLHFFSDEFFEIEFVKSEVRYKILELFRANDIEIPFPQRDMWVRNADEQNNNLSE